MGHKGRFCRVLAWVLVAALSGSAASCGGRTEAASMKLRKTEGKVEVEDSKGKDIEPEEQMHLYSGYLVGTRKESYAWIDLDHVKLTKVDAKSEVEIKKKKDKLEIVVNSGNLFFNITEPLGEDETLDIRSSSMVVGIRGTCGWVEVEDDSRMRVYILEGKVKCSVAGEKSADGVTTSVLAGEMAEMTVSKGKADISVEEIAADQIPDFVMEELEDDEKLHERILDDSGLDVWEELEEDAAGQEEGEEDTVGDTGEEDWQEEESLGQGGVSFGSSSSYGLPVTETYDPATRIRRVTLDPQGYQLEVYHEIPVFEETTVGYQKINQHFRELEEAFFGPNGEAQSVWGYVTDPQTPEIGDTYNASWGAQITTETPELVSVRLYYDWYMGGTTSYGETCYVFDPETGEQLVITDVIDGTEEEIRGLVQEALRAEYGFGDALSADAIKDYEANRFDFYVLDGHVHVGFDKYEIAAGAAGSFDVELEVPLKRN